MKDNKKSSKLLKRMFTPGDLPPVLHCSGENRLFAPHVAKLAHGATFLPTPFLGNTDESDNGYIEKAGD